MAGYVCCNIWVTWKSIRDCLLTHCGGFYLVCIPQWAIKKQYPHQLQMMRFLESKPKQALWTQKGAFVATCSASGPVKMGCSFFYIEAWLLATGQSWETSAAQDILGAVNPGMLWELPVGPQRDPAPSAHHLGTGQACLSAFISWRWVSRREGKNTWRAVLLCLLWTCKQKQELEDSPQSLQVMSGARQTWGGQI